MARRDAPGAAAARNPFGVPTNDEGIPLEPLLRPSGGGGSSTRYAMGFWCFPLPPEGPVRVYVEWADRGIEETSVEFDAGLIREAAARAVVLWEPE